MKDNYNPQVDDLDNLDDLDDLKDKDEYYLLNLEHRRADRDPSITSLFPNGRSEKPEPVIKTEEVYEDYKGLFPIFSPVSVPENAEEGWKRVVNSINRMNEDYISTHQQVS